MHIVYLEDEPNDARLVERYIRGTAHQLSIATTVQDAEALLVEQPDLLLVDIMLDERVEGYNFVKKLRGQGNTTSVIAITGLTLPQDVEYCQQVGCNAILPKPYTIEQLASIIETFNV